MSNDGKLFDDRLTNWFIYEAVFKKSQCQMSIYYKYATDRSKLVLLYYIDDFIYWYTYEELGKWFMNTLGKRFHVNFLGYTYFFMSIGISQLKDHFISVGQDRYATYGFAKYLDIAIIK